MLLNQNPDKKIKAKYSKLFDICTDFKAHENNLRHNRLKQKKTMVILLIDDCARQMIE